MSSYYYLMAQLPGIYQSASGGGTLPFSYEYFMELCSRFLSEKDMKKLMSISLEPPRAGIPTGSVLLDRWFEWERNLRFALAGIRAVRMKKDRSSAELGSAGYGGAVQGISPDILQIARTAAGFDSPLEAERYLDEKRKEALNNFTGFDAFAADAVFAYALRLKLMERASLFKEESGMASYRTIYNQILGESK